VITLPSARTRSASVPFLFRASECIDENGIFALGYGQRLAGVFTRASRKRVLDQNGRLFTVPNGSPAIAATPARGLLLEPQRTNLCLRSEDFGTSWTLTGTGTRTPAAHSASGVVLDLLDDTDAAAVTNWSQTIVFTADGDKAFSFHVKAGTAAAPVIKLRSVGVADRGRATVTWNAGVPTVTASIGTVQRVIPMADGVYRVLMTATGVVAGETNSLQVYPASDGTAALTGSVYAGGMQAENGAVPSSYMPTAGATATRQADSLYFPFALRPSAMTLYVRGTDLGTRLEPGAYIAQVSLTNNNPRVHINRTVGTARMQFQTVNAAGTFSTLERATGGDTAVGDLVEYRALLSAAGGLGFGVSLNGGSEILATPIVGTALEAAWSGPRLWIGTNGAGAVGLFLFSHVVVAMGAQSLDTMRELAGI
jgi:hypothetical protein